MKVKFKAIAFALSVILAFMLVGCGGGKDTTTNPKVDPPAPVLKVHSVTLKYNDKAIVGGMLNVDVTAKSVQFGAEVRKDEGAAAEIKYSSSALDVATIDAASGLATLKAEGETIISVTAGDKKQEIVLVVGNSFAPAPQSYNITVVGGTASTTKAAAGEYVILSANIPEHKIFLDWQYSVESVWLNGNSFKMPASDITITADYDDMLYKLNVVGAKVTDDGTGEFTGEGTDGGNIKDGDLPEFDVRVYNFIYDTPLTLKAIDEPASKMFVGWDYGSKNNRKGDMGDPELKDITMPDETLTVWAIFSDKVNKVFTSETVPYRATGSKLIENGVPSGENADPDLGGASGYRLGIRGNNGAQSDFPENITGTVLDTMITGTQTLKATFKNHHATLPVTLEVYATFHGNITTSGHVTVPAGEVVTKFFPANLGFNEPWMGVAVRENVGGTSADILLVDMVLSAAPTYPDGDKLLEVSGAAQWVTLDAKAGDKDYDSFDGWPDYKPKQVNNNLGLTLIAAYGENFNFANNKIPYASIKITNMPAFDAAKPTTTIYVKVINNVNNIEDPVSTFAFAVGATQKPDIASAQTVVLEKTGQMDVIAITVPRTATDGGQFYFSVIKPKSDGSGLYGHVISIQLAYNNVLGYEEI